MWLGSETFNLALQKDREQSAVFNALYRGWLQGYLSTVGFIGLNKAPSCCFESLRNWTTAIRNGLLPREAEESIFIRVLTQGRTAGEAARRKRSEDDVLDALFATWENGYVNGGGSWESFMLTMNGDDDYWIQMRATHSILFDGLSTAEEKSVLEEAYQRGFCAGGVSGS
jgi:hypothetical protein